MGKELWKKAPGFDGYEVSSLGRIRNLDGVFSKFQDNGKGYKKFTRKINGMKKSAYVHRLVAMAFVPNPKGKPCINHLDCDPSNNSAENLEWCTHKENMEYMNKLGRNKRTEKWIEHLYDTLENNGILRPVIGKSIETGDLIIFDYLNQVKHYGFQPSSVCLCCKGKRKQHKGYMWRYG